MKLDVSDTFPVSRQTYVDDIFFDEDFNAALHDHLGFRSRNVVEDRDDGAVRFQRIEFVSGEKLPWAARKLWGDFVSWTEELTFYKDEWRVESRMIPDAMSSRVRTTTDMRFEEPAPGRCRRRVTIDVSVRVPVVGNKIATSMAKNVRESFRKTAAFTERYIRENDLE